MSLAFFPTGDDSTQSFNCDATLTASLISCAALSYLCQLGTNSEGTICSKMTSRKRKSDIKSWFAYACRSKDGHPPLQSTKGSDVYYFFWKCACSIVSPKRRSMPFSCLCVHGWIAKALKIGFHFLFSWDETHKIRKKKKNQLNCCTGNLVIIYPLIAILFTVMLKKNWLWGINFEMYNFHKNIFCVDFFLSSDFFLQ